MYVALACDHPKASLSDHRDIGSCRKTTISLFIIYATGEEVNNEGRENIITTGKIKKRHLPAPLSEICTSDLMVNLLSQWLRG